MPQRQRRGCPGDEHQPGREWPLRAGSAADQTCKRAREQQGDRARQQIKPRLRRARIEAVVHEALDAERQSVRCLDEVRDEDERPEHGEAGDKRGQVREEHRPHRHHPHVDHRLGHA